MRYEAEHDPKNDLILQQDQISERPASVSFLNSVGTERRELDSMSPADKILVTDSQEIIVQKSSNADLITARLANMTASSHMSDKSHKKITIDDHSLLTKISQH